MGSYLGWFWLPGIMHRTERYSDCCLESASVKRIARLAPVVVPEFDWDGHYVLVFMECCAYVWC